MFSIVQDLLLLLGCWPWYRLALEEDSRGATLLIYGSTDSWGPYEAVNKIEQGTMLTLGGVKASFEGSYSTDYEKMGQPITMLEAWNEIVGNCRADTPAGGVAIKVMWDAFRLFSDGPDDLTLESIRESAFPTLDPDHDSRNLGPHAEYIRRRPHQYQWLRRMAEQVRDIGTANNVHFHITYGIDRPSICVTHPEDETRWAIALQDENGLFHIELPDLPQGGPLTERELIPRFDRQVEALCSSKVSECSSHPDTHACPSASDWMETAAQIAKEMAEEYEIRTYELVAGHISVTMKIYSETGVTISSSTEEVWTVKSSWERHYQQYTVLSAALLGWKCAVRRLYIRTNAMAQARKDFLVNRVVEVAERLERETSMQVWIDMDDLLLTVSAEVNKQGRWCSLKQVHKQCFYVQPDYQDCPILVETRSEALEQLHRICLSIFTDPNCTPQHPSARFPHKKGPSTFWRRMNALGGRLAQELQLDLRRRLVKYNLVRFALGAKWVEIERGISSWYGRTSQDGENGRAQFYGEAQAVSYVEEFFRALAQPAD